MVLFPNHGYANSYPSCSSPSAPELKQVIMKNKPGSSYVASALAEACERYIARNSNSQKLHLDGLEYLPGGNTRTILHVNPFPLTFASGEGATLTSVDADVYLDFLGEYSAGIFGHSNSAIA